MADMDALILALDAVRRRFVDVLPQHVERLESFANSQDAEALLAVRFATHKIAGTAGTLGYTALGQLARSVESALPVEFGAESPPELMATVSELLVEARAIIARGPGAAPQAEQAHGLFNQPSNPNPAPKRLFGAAPEQPPIPPPRLA